MAAPGIARAEDFPQRQTEIIRAFEERDLSIPAERCHFVFVTEVLAPGFPLFRTTHLLLAESRQRLAYTVRIWILWKVREGRGNAAVLTQNRIPQGVLVRFRLGAPDLTASALI
jgi:hypothetical protein